MNKIKDNRGGARLGAGRKPVKEKRIHANLVILPSILEPFKEQHGRGWSRRVEELVKEDLREPEA